MLYEELPDELDWSAFCYAAGEMTPAEAEAFEARLADDQPAREALARAVELTQAVATAESLAPFVTVSPAALRPESSRWTRRLGWMALGSAASLLVALVWSGSGAWSGSGGWFHGTMKSSIDQSELAAAWTQTRQELADGESGLWYSDHLTASELNEVSNRGDSFLAPSADDQSLIPVAPDWMTAAVETYAAEPADADSTPFDGERREN